MRVTGITTLLLGLMILLLGALFIWRSRATVVITAAGLIIFVVSVLELAKGGI